MNKTKVVIADDHQIVRNGLVALFENEETIDVVGEAHDGAEALELVTTLNPDIVISDISMPKLSGIQLAEKIASVSEEVSVLILSMHNDQDYILDALNAGARGYLPKDADEYEIIAAVKNLAKGKMFFSSSISDVLATRILKKNVPVEKEEKLTQRELEVLGFIVDGFSNKEIAEQLKVSKRTVDSHRSNLMEKLKANNTADIVRIAFRKDLVE